VIKKQITNSIRITKGVLYLKLGSNDFSSWMSSLFSLKKKIAQNENQIEYQYQNIGNNNT
jgi:hypothetical protein